MKRPALALLAAALCVFSLSSLGDAAILAGTAAQRADCWQSDPGDQAVLQAFKGKGRPLLKLFAEGTITLKCETTKDGNNKQVMIGKLIAPLYCRKGQSSLSGYKGFVAFSPFDVNAAMFSGLHWKLGTTYWSPAVHRTPDDNLMPLSEFFPEKTLPVYTNGAPSKPAVTIGKDDPALSVEALQNAVIVTKWVPPANLSELLQPCSSDPNPTTIQLSGIHYIFAGNAPAASAAPPAQSKSSGNSAPAALPTNTEPASGLQAQPHSGNAPTRPSGSQASQITVPSPAPQAGNSTDNTGTRNSDNALATPSRTPVPESRKPTEPALPPVPNISAPEMPKAKNNDVKPEAKKSKAAEASEATVAVTAQNPIERGGVKWWHEPFFTITYQDPQTLQTGKFKQTGPNSWEHNGAEIGTTSEISRHSPGVRTIRGTKFLVDKGWEYRLPPLKLGEATQISAVELNYPHRTREFKILTIGGPSCPQRMPRRTQS